MSDPDPPGDDDGWRDATNRDFRRHDQVDKGQRYRLAEHEGPGDSDEAIDDDAAIRTCDLSRARSDDPAERRRFADELGAALAEIGFAILERTGIDPALYDEAEVRTRRMFEAHDAATKARFTAARHGSVNQGWFPLRETSGIHPDLVEGWVLCRRAFALDGRRPDFAAFWPDTADEPFFRRLCLAHEALVDPVLRAIAAFLGQPEDALVRRVRPVPFGLRLNYYPPVPDDPKSEGAGRLLGHEDVTVITLLPAPRIEGLQVLDRRSGRFVRLNAPPGSIVLNTGDYMQRLSNDRLPSTTHRVSKPRDPALRRVPRVSFPLNVYLHEDDVLEVLPGLGEPRYPPVRAIAFHTRATAKYYGDDYAVDDP